MKNIHLPYGKSGLNFEVDPENLLGIYQASLPAPAAVEYAEVERALDALPDYELLENIARGKRNAVIIASDHTRPVPSRILIPALLRRLRLAEPDIEVTILIATGCHRSSTPEELKEKFGTEVFEKERIVMHDCDDQNRLVELGTLPSGGTLKVNKLALETELLIAEGFIEPHFFAGFSGGRKSVLPGIAARETVMANHCAEFIASEFARTGNLENNPIHLDMLFAARQAKLAFILNAVINEQKKIVRAFAGNMEKAHHEGCCFLRKHCSIAIPEADIVITGNGGYPLDQNIYQSVKGMTAGEAVCRKGGVIIIAASCSDGHGGEDFFRELANCSSIEALQQKIAGIPRNKTVPDQWQYQILARILTDHQVIIVTRDCDHDMIRSMKMLPASSVEEALDMAGKLLGFPGRIAVIPDGVSVIVQRA